MDFVIKLILMIVISGVVYVIAMKSHETTSWWVSRLMKLSGKLADIHPFWLCLGFLVLIFFELGMIIWLMKVAPWAVKVIYIFSTANIAFVVLSLWMDNRMGGILGVWWTILKVLSSIALGVSWIIYPAWFVYNLVGIICGVGFLQLFPSLKFKSALALGMAIIIYDIVGVYWTDWIILLVKGLSFVPPAVIYIPAALKASTAGMSMIGLGDIIIGGMMLLMARRYDATKHAFAGYALGVTLSFALAVLTSHGVPATMFIVPLMLLFVRHSAKRSQNPAWLADQK
ncbi:TPA: hypothetical protein DIU27_04375 [Candidatus Collierbacteria bacterium]|uniref:Uncharacterized protein n=1 Tax=Candidatus Collierbacteria bacterium GW2011_GWB2_44_22 TaxID=1618387 RepID=A0A0G1K5X8_9BACT|nr:MAG: hypothetical protein UW31_C0013G0026 [Candidatus Collierbacteria bacterium GW2011_GWA2_44_13]KKT51707.1 MAG: hypothetical protein UW44_C0008G0029 [Candidatus Collierbacteria bacterium GW2011_GWB2_44_22]KKT62504.1 MAG: hypothetical protein UW56_C0006G0027 [Candidatus Collierbacteria bacterium GW2011_GWD1_44_27]KKT66926.1 MAG: hypothetical protein UW58_C0001G0030 [Candidatus Collierbacteria bacterium GW2011_GWC2_44_30]KKT88753.1 MAG: hypothetical protein UW88_C0008G0027 [Candidatus Collie